MKIEMNVDTAQYALTLALNMVISEYEQMVNGLPIRIVNTDGEVEVSLHLSPLLDQALAWCVTTYEDVFERVLSAYDVELFNTSLVFVNRVNGERLSMPLAQAARFDAINQSLQTDEFTIDVVQNCIYGPNDECLRIAQLDDARLSHAIRELMQLKREIDKSWGADNLVKFKLDPLASPAMLMFDDSSVLDAPWKRFRTRFNRDTILKRVNVQLVLRGGTARPYAALVYEVGNVTLLVELHHNAALLPSLKLWVRARGLEHVITEAVCGRSLDEVLRITIGKYGYFEMKENKCLQFVEREPDVRVASLRVNIPTSAYLNLIKEDA